jgi:hypothetical protein
LEGGFGGNRLGRKASDEFTVPLCRMHHREVHRVGDERAWWKAAGVDPLKVAHTPCMTGEPDSPMLTNLGAAAGVTGELFHTPMGAAFADATLIAGSR